MPVKFVATLSVATDFPSRHPSPPPPTHRTGLQFNLFAEILRQCGPRIFSDRDRDELTSGLTDADSGQVKPTQERNHPLKVKPSRDRHAAPRLIPTRHPVRWPNQPARTTTPANSHHPKPKNQPITRP